MSRRTAAAGVGTLLVGAAASALLAVPASAASVVARWHMNEPAGTTVMTDSSGHANHGRAHGVRRGAAGVSGTAYSFSRPAVVTVPDDGSLDPGSAPIAISLHLRTTSRPNDWNVLQKGRSTTNGGNYKIEVTPEGQARCVFRGSKGLAAVVGGPVLTDGRWHRVECSKRYTAVRLQVDNGKTYTSHATVGSIRNGAQVTIGAKDRDGDDQYSGLLDEIEITIG